jgi:hypothetical protein
MADTRNECIQDYPSITECLVRAPCLTESANCFIKDVKHEQFETESKRHSADNFYCFKDRLRKRAVRVGENHPCLTNWSAIMSRGNIRCIYVQYVENAARCLSGACGMTDRGMNVQLIAVER